jgi:hypothetical protein
MLDCDWSSDVCSSDLSDSRVSTTWVSETPQKGHFMM